MILVTSNFYEFILFVGFEYFKVNYLSDLSILSRLPFL